MLHGGPGFYRFQPWVYDCIVGNNEQDHLIKYLSKEDIPLHAGSSDLVN